jgi:hypothetical protein
MFSLIPEKSQMEIKDLPYACQCCFKKNAKYILHLSNDMNCPYCGFLKYPKNYKLTICDIKCPDLGWEVSNHMISKNIQTIGTYPQSVEYQLCVDSDECYNCGKKDFSEGLFTGMKLCDRNEDIMGGQSLINNMIDACLNENKLLNLAKNKHRMAMVINNIKYDLYNCFTKYSTL